MSAVNIGFYVVIGQYFKDSGFSDGKPSIRVAKTRPSCAPHEVAIWLSMTLPKSLFVRPNLQAQITVPDSAAPMVITPEIEQNIAAVVQEQLGITMQVSAAGAA